MKTNIIARLFGLLLLILCTTTTYGEIPPGYYDAAVGKKKADLKAAMHKIIGTAKTLSYGSGDGSTWSGFYKVDRREDNSVVDRYCYDKHYFTSATSAVSGMNIEHSFPKSWWGGGKNQAYQDIHHLMPCESTINSKKSNYPIGVVTNDKSGNGCTKVGTGSDGTQLWEPADEWKGDFARAYFYMATCYSNLTWQGTQALKQLENNDWPTLQKWTYDLLLQWNAQDPVGDLERTRNDGVYAIQGNRNPFIDFPDLAEYIWGSKINDAWQGDDPITPPIPDDKPDTPNVGELPEYTFASTYDPFVAKLADGSSASDIWTANTTYKCAVANAYNAGKVADAYLISPVIDLTNYKSANLTFDHATGFHKTSDPSTKFSLVVTEGLDDALIPNNASWQKVTIPSWPETGEKSWTDFANAGDIDLSSYCGKKIRVAFRYESTNDACWGWEVKNFKMTGEKSDASLIENIFFQVKTTPMKVYSLDGTLIGDEMPNASGVYIIKTKEGTRKVVK